MGTRFGKHSGKQLVPHSTGRGSHAVKAGNMVRSRSDSVGNPTAGVSVGTAPTVAAQGHGKQAVRNVSQGKKLASLSGKNFKRRKFLGTGTATQA